MTARIGHDLFNGGPPTRLQILAGLMRPGEPRILRRIIILLAVSWLPLAVLTGLQDAILLDGSFWAFLGDFAVQARCLAALPLLIGAEAVCLPRLSGIARQFRDGELIAAADDEAFDRACDSTRRLRDSTQLEVLVVGLTGAIIAAVIFSLPPDFFPSWHRIGGTARTSPAGWWHTLVSAPILFTLLLGWAWRLGLWTRFLWLMSRLRLRLVASHPDRAAGLRFLGVSTQSFCILAFALGAIVAGTVANRVVHDGAPLASFRYVLLGFDVLCLLLFVSPLLVFSPLLLECWRQGIQRYGVLSRRVGEAFERKWLDRAPGDDVLEANDFSATTDLYSVAANVYGLALMPIGLGNLIFLAAGAALPFIPVVLMAVPPQVLLQMLAEKLF